MDSTVYTTYLIKVVTVFNQKQVRGCKIVPYLRKNWVVFCHYKQSIYNNMQLSLLRLSIYNLTLVLTCVPEGIFNSC